jgi:hypothetical protein
VALGIVAVAGSATAIYYEVGGAVSGVRDRAAGLVWWNAGVEQHGRGRSSFHRA